MGNIDAQLINLHHLEIPLMSSKFTVVTGVAEFESGNESNDNSFEIKFKFKLVKINDVIERPIGTANLSTGFPFACGWWIEDFTVKWEDITKEFECSLHMRQSCGEKRDLSTGSVPFQVSVYHH